MNYEPGYNTSWAWRKICQVKNIFKRLFTNGNGDLHRGQYTLTEGYKWICGESETKEWWHWMNNR